MSENQSNFESLRRLLALKRHETPPPGYFDAFSRRVIARIRAGETEAPASLSQRLSDQVPWLLKFLQAFEAKPAFACAYASALCLLLIAGVILAERPEPASQASFEPMSQTSSLLAPTTLAALPQQPVNQVLIADSSTNPVFNFQSTTSRFGQIPIGAQTVSYSLPNN